MRGNIVYIILLWFKFLGRKNNSCQQFLTADQLNPELETFVAHQNVDGGGVEGKKLGFGDSELQFITWK